MAAAVPLTRIAFLDPILSYSVANLNEALESRLVNPNWKECVEVYGSEVWRAVARSLVLINSTTQEIDEYDYDDAAGREEAPDPQALSSKILKFFKAQTVSWVLRALV